jgi:Transketolase, thiamine diphosphate binding domain
MTPVAQTSVGTDLGQLSIDTIRALSIDAVQQAKSGHPVMLRLRAAERTAAEIRVRAGSPGRVAKELLHRG